MKRRGLSIIDIIFAVLFLSIVLGISMMVFSTSLKKSEESIYTTSMTTLMMNEVEKLSAGECESGQYTDYYNEKLIKIDMNCRHGRKEPIVYRLDIDISELDDRLCSVNIKACHIKRNLKLEINTKVMRK